MDYHAFFNRKKVTQLGLGLLGRGVGDAEFLARHGAELIVTDMKSADELNPSLSRLQGFKNITYHLGGHRLEDFNGCDFVLKAAGVPLDSPFIAEARKNKIPIEMDASLFAKLAPKTIIIGVTGTRGKSTTAALIYEILKIAGKRAFLGGNIKDTATLPLLEKVREEDFVVLELDSWQLQGFGEAGISPHISVFTTFMPDHMNYYKGDMDRYFEDKAQIFRHQKKGDHFIVGEDIAGAHEWNTKGEVRIARRGDVSGEWMRFVLGEHNRLNVACAREVGRIFKIPTLTMRKAVNNFHGLAGRLELKRMVDGVAYYNDTNATTPDATIAALKSLGRGKNIVLIMGGSDKGLDMKGLIQEIPHSCKGVVLLAGTGSDIIRDRLKKTGVFVNEAKDLQESLIHARTLASKGDIVLFSPAFASFGMFKNEYDRGEQFNKLIIDSF